MWAEGVQSTRPQNSSLQHLNYLELKAPEKEQMCEWPFDFLLPTKKQVIEFPVGKETFLHQEENILTTRGADTQIDLYE